MNVENKEFENLQKRVEGCSNSYITKEDFLKMIETLKFTHIEYANIQLITDYLILLREGKVITII